jgi:hypothetical protein
VFGRAEVLQVAGMPHGRQRERLLLNRVQSLLPECGHSSHSRRDDNLELDLIYRSLKVDI